MSRVIINNTNAGSVFTDPVTISDMQNQHIKNITIKSRKHPDQLTLLQIINSNQLHIDTVIIEGILDDSSRIHWAETVANGIQILSENVKIGKVVLKNIHCGIQIRAEGCCVDSIIASNVSGDLWQITASNCEIKSYSVFNMLKVFAHDLSESGKNGNPKGIYHALHPKKSPLASAQQALIINLREFPQTFFPFVNSYCFYAIGLFYWRKFSFYSYQESILFLDRRLLLFLFQCCHFLTQPASISFLKYLHVLD